jgi:pimeloyl-ACP methyl ester carboxylesterase
VLVAAIGECRDRLMDQGIDLAAYAVAATVADYEDLRRAIGIPLVNVNANLNGSRISSEYVRTHPDVVRVLIMDSPALASPDVLTVAPAALDLAIENLSAMCAAQPTCHARIPDLAVAIQEATRKLDASPVTLEIDGTVEAIRLGRPIQVVIDGAAYLRFVRHTLGIDGGELAGEIVRTTERVLAGTLGPNDGMPNILAVDGGTCIGLMPGCGTMSFGSLYSLTCGSLAPATDQARLEADIAGRPAYADLFAPSALLAACDVWPKASAEAPVGAWPAEMPTLVMRGALDPYSTPLPDVERAIGGPDTYVYEVPNQSYNSFGEVDCPRLIRNAWIDAPNAPPADVSCLKEIAPILLGI